MPSDLPILPSDPAPPRKTTAEKYGGLYYLGVGGLIVVIGLVAWFGIGVWSMRSVWRDIYILHDPERTVAERVEAAHALSRNPKVTQRQYWDIALRKDLPPLARYLMAESLTTEAVAADPRGYAVAVARSEGWPDWYRLLVARPMAYAANKGYGLPPEILDETLESTTDPYLRLWTAYTLASLGEETAAAPAANAQSLLTTAAQNPGPTQPLARMLIDALNEPGPDRRHAQLDRATLWLRTNHPEAATIWKDWTPSAGDAGKGDVADS